MTTTSLSRQIAVTEGPLYNNCLEAWGDADGHLRSARVTMAGIWNTWDKRERCIKNIISR